MIKLCGNKKKLGFVFRQNNMSFQKQDLQKLVCETHPQKYNTALREAEDKHQDLTVNCVSSCQIQIQEAKDEVELLKQDNTILPESLKDAEDKHQDLTANCASSCPIQIQDAKAILDKLQASTTLADNAAACNVINSYPGLDTDYIRLGTLTEDVLKALFTSSNHDGMSTQFDRVIAMNYHPDQGNRSLVDSKGSETKYQDVTKYVDAFLNINHVDDQDLVCKNRDNVIKYTENTLHNVGSKVVKVKSLSEYCLNKSYQVDLETSIAEVFKHNTSLSQCFKAYHNSMNNHLPGVHYPDVHVGIDKMHGRGHLDADCAGLLHHLYNVACDDFS